MSSYHIQGRIYPSDEIVDLWIRDGTFTFEEIPDAKDIGTEGMYLFPGLVDAHCHLTMDFQDYSRKLSHDEIHKRKDEHVDAGELLVRDMGASPTSSMRPSTITILSKSKLRVNLLPHLADTRLPINQCKVMR